MTWWNFRRVFLMFIQSIWSRPYHWYLDKMKQKSYKDVWKLRGWLKWLYETTGWLSIRIAWDFHWLMWGYGIRIGWRKRDE